MTFFWDLRDLSGPTKRLFLYPVLCRYAVIEKVSCCNSDNWLKRYFSQAAPGISGAVALVAVLAGNVPAQASVPLRRADIEQILNRVELIPRGRSARTARVSDFLSIGDALRTAAASRAELAV